MESLVRFFLLSLIASSSAVMAQSQSSLEGIGRVSIWGGWRYTPNDGFYSKATAQGYPPISRSTGGPMGTATFAYSVTDDFELGLDLFAGREVFHLRDLPAISSTSYGVLVGVRLQKQLGLVVPYVGAFAGPTLIYTANPMMGKHEVAATGYGAGAGLNVAISERFAVMAEAKFFLARGVAEGIGGLNGGGLWAGIGITYYFQREPKEGMKPFL